MDSILEELGKKSVPLRRDISCIKLPVNCLEFTGDGIDQFNQLYQYCRKMEAQGKYTRLQWTQGRGKDHYNIRVGKNSFLPPAWDIVRYGSGADIYVIDEICFRLQLRPHKKDKLWNGVHCYYYFKKVCKEKFDLELEKFYIPPEEGKKIHKSIIEAPTYVIENRFRDRTFYSTHHLDLNSSYLSGIAKSYPEFEEPIQYFYKNRKKNPHFKEILTHTTGFFRCDRIGHQLAHLTQAGIEYTRERLDALTDELRSAGYFPISYTTDGIWYTGQEEPYHGPGEGKDLGQWKNDHINCKFRIRSPKAYEFVENGRYNVRLSGKTLFDAQCPRENWTWGDLYRAADHTIYLVWTEKEGFQRLIGTEESNRILDNKTIVDMDE